MLCPWGLHEVEPCDDTPGWYRCEPCGVVVIFTSEGGGGDAVSWVCHLCDYRLTAETAEISRDLDEDDDEWWTTVVCADGAACKERQRKDPFADELHQ